MNYCLDDKKCHEDDLLIPPRHVYLELHREIYEKTGNRQCVNEVWGATLRLSGTDVNEEDVKLMRNNQVSPLCSKQRPKPPVKTTGQVTDTNPPAHLHRNYHGTGHKIWEAQSEPPYG